MVADLSAVKKGQDAAGGDGPAGVLSAEAVAEMASPYLVQPLQVEDWQVIHDKP